MSKIKLPHASGNSMSIAAPATNPASDLTLTLPATIGTAGQYLTVDGSGNLVWADPPGITHLDEWGITSSVNTSSDNYEFQSNWESRDYTQAGKIGSGMTQSSGVFTFPKTGIWMVSYYTTGEDVNEASPSYIGLRLCLTPNGGSNINLSHAYTGTGGTANQHFSLFNQVVLDITNIGDTVNLRADVHGSTNVTFFGHTSQQYGTGMTFIRLGGT